MTDRSSSTPIIAPALNYTRLPLPEEIIWLIGEAAKNHAAPFGILS